MWMVPYVEELSTELQAHPLTERENEILDEKSVFTKRGPEIGAGAASRALQREQLRMRTG